MVMSRLSPGGFPEAQNATKRPAILFYGFVRPAVTKPRVHIPRILCSTVPPYTHDAKVHCGKMEKSVSRTFRVRS